MSPLLIILVVLLAWTLASILLGLAIGKATMLGKGHPRPTPTRKPPTDGND